MQRIPTWALAVTTLVLVVGLAVWVAWAPNKPAVGTPLLKPTLKAPAQKRAAEGVDPEPVAEDLPTMPVGTADLPEQLDRRQLEAGMDKVRPHVERCQSVEPFGGVLTVRVTIAKSGSVQSVVVLPPADKTPFGDCVVKAIKHHGGFPRFRGSLIPAIELTYPFLFKSEAG